MKRPEPCGVLGCPIQNLQTAADARSTFQNYRNGRIYKVGTKLLEIHGSLYRFESFEGGRLEYLPDGTIQPA